MAKTPRSKARFEKREKPRGFEEEIVTPPTTRKAEPLEPKTEQQKKYISAIKNFQVTFGLGPAGTGKTYIAGAIACEMLTSKRVDRIIITRPAVEAGESLGFLPGEISDKYEPYLAPLRSVLDERLGKSFVTYLVKSEKIQAMPLAYMRGMTFDDAFVILDEAQNVTPAQMKMFLTRIGKNCKVVIDGDEEQMDINGICGLTDAIKRVSYIPSIKVIRFGDDDIVRSGIVSEIIKAYRAK